MAHRWVLVKCILIVTILISGAPELISPVIFNLKITSVPWQPSLVKFSTLKFILWFSVYLSWCCTGILAKWKQMLTTAKGLVAWVRVCHRGAWTAASSEERCRDGSFSAWVNSLAWHPAVCRPCFSPGTVASWAPVECDYRLASDQEGEKTGGWWCRNLC